MIKQIKPGQYRTRNGIVAVVTHTNDKMEAPFIWVGSVAGEIEVWDRHGRYHSNGRESPWDLVARIPDEPPADDRMRRALQLIAQLADTKSRAHKERFCPNGEGDGIANGWRVAEAMREIANDVVGNDRIEQQKSPLDLVARIPDAAPADDRIERALQVLRNAQTYDWVEAEVLSEVRKILEATP
jgi:hypothetical protein